MITEIVRFHLLPGHEGALEAAVHEGVRTLIQGSPGFQNYRFLRGIEHPDQPVLLIQWATLENHTKDFREGPLFPQWRALISPHFSQAPQVSHYETGQP